MSVLWTAIAVQWLIEFQTCDHLVLIFSNTPSSLLASANCWLELTILVTPSQFQIDAYQREARMTSHAPISTDDVAPGMRAFRREVRNSRRMSWSLTLKLASSSYRTGYYRYFQQFGNLDRLDSLTTTLHGKFNPAPSQYYELQ